MTDHRLEIAQQAVVAVGGGRGFVVETRDSWPVIITAAHCLPEPPALSWQGTNETTYKELLGPLGGECKVWAECIFVDTVGDIAVLTGPDYQELGEELGEEQLGQYEDLTEKSVPVGPPLESEIPRHPRAQRGWLLSLENTLLPCKIEIRSHIIAVSEVKGEIVPGMSGSPILDQAGRAVGIVATGIQNPCLTEMLPVWILRRFGL